MATDISVSLPPELLELIRAKVESGRYHSASEVVSQALRLLDLADQLAPEDVAELRHAWQVGVDSAAAGELDFAELRLAAVRERAERSRS